MIGLAVEMVVRSIGGMIKTTGMINVTKNRGMKKTTGMVDVMKNSGMKKTTGMIDVMKNRGMKKTTRLIDVTKNIPAKTDVNGKAEIKEMIGIRREMRGTTEIEETSKML